MPRRKSKSRQALVSIIMFVTFILSLVMMVNFALETVQDKEQQKIRSNLRHALSTTQELHHVWLSHRHLELQRLSQYPPLRKLLSDHHHLHHANHDYLAELNHLTSNTFKLLLGKFPNEHYWLVDPQGEILTASNQRDWQQIHPAFQLRPDLLTLQSSAFIPNLSQDLHQDPQDSMLLIQPVIEGQQTMGLIVASIDPAVNFSRITQLTRIGRSGESYAFDKQGILISESRFTEQMQALGTFKLGTNTALRLRIADPEVNTLHGHQPRLSNAEQSLTHMAQQATQGKNGDNLEGYRDYRGVTVVGAWRWDQQWQFGLASEMDKQEAYSNYYFLRNVIISSSACIAAFACAWFFLLWQRLNRTKWRLRREQLLLEQKVKERTHELEGAKLNLEHAYNELERISETDGLTGIANRRRADLKLREEWRRAQRNTYPITIMMIDVDFFKLYNDNYGHLAGDECLRKIAQALDSASVCRRPGDLLARYGGEEFIVMLCNSDHDYANLTAEKLRHSVLEQHIPHQFSQVDGCETISISIGAAIIKEPGLSLEKMIDLADKGLYQSKNAGRNRCTLIQH